MADTAKKKAFIRSGTDLDRMRSFTLAGMILAAVLLGWQSDDSYHGYVMVKHLLEGNGFVYNIGERATASSCPLFTLVIACGYFVFRKMFLVSLLICVLFSTSAYIITLKNFS